MKKFAFAIAATALLATSANAASVTLDVVRSPIPQDAIDAGAPEGTITEIFATTDADILSIGKVRIDLGGTGDVFQVPPPFGSDTAAPDPAFVALNAALKADTFITTPGATNLLGSPLPGDGDTTFGDLSNDGPQNNFLIARIGTARGTFGRFSGQVTVAGSAGPESFEFNVVVPEPATLMLASFGLVGFVASRRRS